jgi:glucose/arabinose dehydrogenase
MRRTLRLLALAALALAVAAPATLNAQPEAITVTPIATGLNNPRGLEVGPDGAIYVAEAGRGGKLCVEDEFCLGFTGSITRIENGSQRRMAGGLFSAAGPDGSFATGLDDVAVAPDGTVYGIMTSAPPEFARGASARVKAQLGRLFRFVDGKRRAVANVGQFEVANNPDGTDVNPNPYGVAASAETLLVVDAGGNTLLSVEGGAVELVAVLRGQRFDGRRSHSVPTTVTIGPDGAYYVGELGGGGSPDGKARVFRVVPGEEPTVHATGFTAISGIAFGPDGSLYVSQYWRNSRATERGNFTGAVIRIAPDGTRTELAKGRLVAVGGVAVDAEGDVYASVNSFFPGRGRVVRIG